MQGEIARHRRHAGVAASQLAGSVHGALSRPLALPAAALAGALCHRGVRAVGGVIGPSIRFSAAVLRLRRLVRLLARL